MAPIKFEDNIKEKIEKRTLQPSLDAWDTLSARLDQEPKKKRFGYWWLSVAASLIGVAIVSLVLFKTTPETLDVTPVLVEDNINLIDKTKIEIKTEVVIETETENVQIDDQKTIEKHPVVAIDKERVNSKKEPQQLKVASVNTDSKKETLQSKNHSVSVDNTLANTSTQVAEIEKIATLEDIKVNEVVAQIRLLQKEKTHVTEGELDSLLKQAEKDIMKQRIYNASTRTVNAEALLLDVEADLENSFRGRVFEALKSGYQKVKTAVADRNN